jgi:putative SOS response-associated peptidase YedK
MCGRYALYGPFNELPATVEGWTERVKNPLKTMERYNAAPTQSMPVFRRINDELQCDDMRWGLIPHWAKSDTSAAKTVNARAETVIDKPSYRDAWARGQRCLVPLSGWYEWQVQPQNKTQPYYFTSTNDNALLMVAGLWASWRNDHNDIVHSYTLLTTQAVGTVAEVHDRQPLVLPAEQWRAWLESENAISMLKPEPLPVKYHPVSAAVGSIRRDERALIEPVVPAQASLAF